MPDFHHVFLPRIAVCVGMSLWKRGRVAELLRAAGDAPVFRDSVAGALAAAARCPGGAIAVWASRIPEGLEEAAVRHGVPLVRVEDGFIRSFGLGSDFRPPCSLVFDTRGIYFDPNRPGDLAAILRETRFDAALASKSWPPGC